MGFKGPSPPLGSYFPAKPRTPATFRSLGNGQRKFVDFTMSEELRDLVAQATDLVRDTAKNVFAVCWFGALFNWDHRPVRKSVPASCKSKPEQPHFQRSCSGGGTRTRDRRDMNPTSYQLLSPRDVCRSFPGSQLMLAIAVMILRAPAFIRKNRYNTPVLDLREDDPPYCEPTRDDVLSRVPPPKALQP